MLLEKLTLIYFTSTVHWSFEIPSLRLPSFRKKLKLIYFTCPLFTEVLWFFSVTVLCFETFYEKHLILIIPAWVWGRFEDEGFWSKFYIVLRYPWNWKWLSLGWMNWPGMVSQEIVLPGTVLLLTTGPDRSAELLWNWTTILVKFYLMLSK